MLIKKLIINDLQINKTCRAEDKKMLIKCKWGIKVDNKIYKGWNLKSKNINGWKFLIFITL